MSNFKNTVRQTFENPEYLAVRDHFWGKASITVPKPEPGPTPATDAAMLAHERTSRMIAALRKLKQERAA